MKTGLAVALLVCVGGCSAEPAVGTEGHQNPSAELLGSAMRQDRVAELKAQILELARANTLNTADIPVIRAQLEPLVQELERYFITDRPPAEPLLVQGAWHSIWFDDPDIDRDPDVFELDRQNIYQVIFPGYYYNVANNFINIAGKRLTTHSFLKGNYQIVDPAGPETNGQARRNVIDLKFDTNRLRLGPIPKNAPLTELALSVEKRRSFALPIPGPQGITGKLWNVYLDDTLRISRGVQDGNGVVDLYILERTVRAGE